MYDDILNFLSDNNIQYELYKHPPIFTVAEGKKYKLDIPGLHTKNLFLRNKEKTKFVLYSIQADKKADLKELAKQMNTSRFSFASPDELWHYLKLKPGSVSPFGLINNHQKNITYIMSNDIWNADILGFHPNDNTATITITHDGLERFLSALDVNYYVLL